MEIWIRSQDKTKLVKVESVYYEEFETDLDGYGSYDTSHEIWYSKKNEDYSIGVYKSKERCLEIIDEIQSLLCDFILATNVDGADALNLKKRGVQGINCYDPHTSPEIKYYERSSMVYEMPKE